MPEPAGGAWLGRGAAVPPTADPGKAERACGSTADGTAARGPLWLLLTVGSASLPKRARSARISIAESGPTRHMYWASWVTYV